jgi:hypothetical protein
MLSVTGEEGIFVVLEAVMEASLQQVWGWNRAVWESQLCSTGAMGSRFYTSYFLVVKPECKHLLC